MKPYMPTCQAVSDSVSAFRAATMPWPNDNPRIGTMAKYWKTMPKAKAKIKSTTQTANIFSAKRECQPNQTATTGTPKTSHSARISPSVQPAPQWVAPVATLIGNGAAW